LESARTARVFEIEQIYYGLGGAVSTRNDLAEQSRSFAMILAARP
jgi:hypothetical protein